jgi:CRISPR/Cas system-associated exonuclease Cas4 (RecB family)
VEIFAAPGEALEAIEIVRRIQKLARAGRRLDEIAILLRSPDRYQPLVEEALRRAGIPAYFSRGVARPDAGGRALLALLTCAAERCSAARFAEYLSLGELPALDTAGAPKEAPPAFAAATGDELLDGFGAAPAPEAADPEPERATSLATPIAWERMLVDAAVIGGRDRWARRLAGLANEYRLRAEEAARDDDERSAAVREQLRRVEALQAFALPLIDLLDTLRTPATWGGWIERLDRLARLALRRPDHARSVIAELEPMAAVGPVGIDEVLAVLSERLRFVRREPARRRYGAVFVGAIGEAAGRTFDVVFIPGLAEGLFPQKSFEDPLLLDATRAKLDARLRTRDRARIDERLLLRRAIASARSRLIASYPTMDVGQGRARVPSFYALEIARAVEGRVPALRAFEERARRRCAVMLAWPAPAHAAEAIDDAEYDLAWHRQHGKVEGACAYLKEAAKPLYRSLRARYARWSNNWQPADGIVQPKDPALVILREHRPTSRSYSASALQEYAACPYRFYLRAIAGLRERDSKPAIERMDPLTRGGLFHEAQHVFLTDVREVESAPVETVIERADAALAAVEAKYREELAPAIRRLWNSEIEDIRNDLRAWARLWHAERKDWEPLFSEFAFGLQEQEGRDLASRPEPAVLFGGGVRVRGAIDAVDRRRGGTGLRITDHKTGRPPEMPPICVGGGAVLQPVLYGMALESLLDVRVESGRLLFCTQRGGYTEYSMPLDDRARAFLNRLIEIIEAEVDRGFLPPAPREGACAWCEYRPVCGPNEPRRAAKKRPEPLDRLNEVRCML